MYVIIEKDTLHNMIRASIEDYPVETRGLLYGHKNTTNYRVTNSYHFRRLEQDRESVEIRRSTKSKLRKMGLGEKVLGDFHSHVIGVLTELSDPDLNTMKNGNVYFLCGLKKANYYEPLHTLKTNTLTCARGGFKVYISAFIGKNPRPIRIRIKNNC